MPTPGPSIATCAMAGAAAISVPAAIMPIASFLIACLLRVDEETTFRLRECFRETARNLLEPFPGSDVAMPNNRCVQRRRKKMGKGLLLWLIGIPIPIILVIWLFGGLS